MKPLPACLIALMLLASAPVTAGEIRPIEGQRSFKGWELNSWQDGAEWRFSLLGGTNRLKFCWEVKNPKAALDLEQVTEALGKLAEMEYVSWPGPGTLPRGSCPLAQPPAEMTERLRQVCERQKLHCSGWIEVPERQPKR